jgi:hypothetical protein
MGRPATDRRRFNGSVSRWRRHSVSPAERRRQSHCSPNRGVDSQNLRYGRWSRRQRLPHCRRTISPRSERPSKAWRDRSQARACWWSIVNLDHGRTWGHPGTAWPNGNNPHISVSHRQLELLCLCCDPRCKHDRRPNARFSERRPELAAPPQQLRKVVRKDAIERLLSRDSP